MMPKALTKEEYKQRLFDAVGNKYSLANDDFPYKNKHSELKFYCNIHKIEFIASAECFMRGPNDVRSSCPKCLEERNHKKRIENRTLIKCAYCGKEFERLNSRLINSKSGLLNTIDFHSDIPYIDYPITCTFESSSFNPQYSITIRPNEYLIWDEELQRFLVLSESVFLMLYKESSW